MLIDHIEYSRLNWDKWEVDSNSWRRNYSLLPRLAGRGSIMKRWEAQAEDIPFFRLWRISSWSSRSNSVITDVPAQPLTFQVIDQLRQELARVDQKKPRQWQDWGVDHPGCLREISETSKSSKHPLAKVSTWKVWRVWTTNANELLNIVPDSGSHSTCTV